jgi:hypothetical protein
MTLFNAIEYLNALIAMLALLAATVNPVTLLYIMVAGTYGFAALAKDHRSLRRCYVISAALHGLIGVCHHLGI